jgi:alpha-mannosidase
VAADSVGGADVLQTENGAEVNLTVLRSPYYGYLTAEDSVEGLERPANDQGVRRLSFCLLSATAGEDAGLPERGVERSQPLQVLFEGSRSGERTAPLSLLRCEPKTVHVAALKAAEDGDGFIARFVETRGVATEAVVTGADGFAPIRTRLRPYEIQSWRWEKGAAPVLVNLLEDAIA